MCSVKMNKQERFNRIEHIIDEIECLDTSIPQEAEMVHAYKQELDNLEEQENKDVIQEL